MTFPLSPGYQINNNRQWLLDVTLAYVQALLSAAEPLKALEVLDGLTPVAVEDESVLVNLRQDIGRRCRHGNDWGAFRDLYLPYSNAHGGALKDTSMLEIHRVQMVLGDLHRQQPTSVMEVGCGDGTITNAMLEACPSAQFTLVDVASTEAIQTELKRRHPNRAVDAHKVTSGMYDWPQRQFDAVVAMEILEHVADQVGLLAALAARLTPSGVLYITTPEANFWVERDLPTRDAMPFQHLVANTPESLVKKALHAGLTYIKVVPSTERHMVASFRGTK